MEPTGREFMVMSRRLARVVLALCAMAALASYVVHARAALVAAEREAAAQGMVLVPGHGDVLVRDLPKAYQHHDGNWTADAHYEGEVHWFPFVTPWLAGHLSRALDLPLYAAYLRLEILLTAAYVAAVALFLWRAVGPGSLWMLPIASGLGAFDAGNGMYPIHAARPAFVCYLLIAGSCLPRKSSKGGPGRFLALGVANGLLGLWNGASFFVALACSGVICGLAAARLRRHVGLASAALRVVLAIVGVVGPMSFLLAPQFLRYGRVEQADSARTWLAPDFAGGTEWRSVFSLPMANDKPTLAVVALFALALAVPKARRRMAPCVRSELVVAAMLAVAVCLATAHLGCMMHDPTMPMLAAFIRAHIPSPPHGFAILSQTPLQLLQLTIAALVVAAAWRALAARSRLVQALVARATGGSASKWLVAGALAGLAILPPKMDPMHVTAFPREVVDFAARARAIAGGSTVFSRDASLMPFGIRVLHAPYPDHANHYVQGERAEAVARIDSALESGDVQAAEYVLDRYGIRYILVDPGSVEPVARECGGDVVLAAAGFRLVARRSSR